MIATIWLIGWMFTIGLCMENEWKNGHGGKMVTYVGTWPLVLGTFIRNQILAEEEE